MHAFTCARVLIASGPSKITTSIVLAQTLLLILLVCSLPLAAQQDVDATANTPAFELQRFDWEGQLKPGTRLLLDNRWGDIRLRQSGGKGVLMHAVMQKIGAKPKVASLQVDEQDDITSLRIVYPEDEQPATVRQGRVDVALLLPTGLAVEINAERGNVTGKTLNNPITVRAVDQQVAFSSTGSIDIATRNGEVAILLKPRGQEKSSAASSADAAPRGRVQTIGGDILIRYYPDVEIGFDMLSGSSKTTDDPRLIKQREYVERRVLMRTSKQADMLQLQSDTGEIVLSNNQYRQGQSVAGEPVTEKPESE